MIAFQCSFNREADAVYNLAGFPQENSRAPFSSLDFLLIHALSKSCSHYERQLSRARLPHPTHTRRNPLCKLLPVLGVPPSRSCFFVGYVSPLDGSFRRNPHSLLSNGQTLRILSSPSRKPTPPHHPLSRAPSHNPLLPRGIVGSVPYARIHSPVGKTGTDMN